MKPFVIIGLIVFALWLCAEGAHRSMERWMMVTIELCEADIKYGGSEGPVSSCVRGYIELERR